MQRFDREPALEEILSDPIVEALMRADGFDRRSLYALLERVVEPHRHEPKHGSLCECGAG
jgi:hypothetical protein